MQTFTSILAFSLAFSPFSQAAAHSLPPTSLAERAFAMGEKQPTHYQATIDITNGIPEGPPAVNATAVGDLQARRYIDYCISGTAQAGVCIGVSSILSQIGTAIGAKFINKSNHHDCTAVDGRIDDVTYRVYASGQHCDTTAQLSTIAGSIDKYLRDVDKDVCGVHCIRLTHGGTWTGYVVLAGAGGDVDSFYCGSSYTFGRCGTGGAKDDHN